MSQFWAYSKSDMSGDLHGDEMLRTEDAHPILNKMLNSMPVLCRKAFFIWSVLVLVTLLLIAMGLTYSHAAHVLLPADKSIYPWKAVVSSDADIGGSSRLRVREQKAQLDYEFFVANAVENPYASLALSLSRDEDFTPFIDLSRYSELTFDVRCSPRNVLTLIFSVVDDRVTQIADRSTYPIPSRYFSCSEQMKRVSVDLRDLEIPDWWLQSMMRDLSEREYSLNKVASLAFAISTQSPRDIHSSVTITDLTLRGRDWVPLYWCSGAAAILWVLAWMWALRKSEGPKSPPAEQGKVLLDDRVSPVYRKLDMEPQRDKQKNAILELMATEYANPDMSLEMTVASLGINRNKINEVLRQETGLTFTGYLNKLKLTEAARLLAEKEAANIAEIAYSVGYNNVSHFNKLFKGEYGCTPKAYKISIQSEHHE